MITYEMRKPIDYENTGCVGVVGENNATIQEFYIKGISDNSLTYSLHLRFADGSVNTVTPDSVVVDSVGTKLIWIVKKNDIFCHGYFQLQIEAVNTNGLIFQTEITTLFADESIAIEEDAYENPNSQTLLLREQAYSALAQIQEQNKQIAENVNIIKESNILEKANKADVESSLAEKADKTEVENSLAEKEAIDNKITDKTFITNSETNYPSIAFLENYFYNIDEADELLDKKANSADVGTALAQKANNFDLQLAINKLGEVENALNSLSLKEIGKKIISGEIKNIMIIGDSTTDGYGGSGYNGSRKYELSTNTAGYCWVNVLKKYLSERYGCNVINAGIYGGSLGSQVQYVNQNNLIPEDGDIDLVISIISTNNCNSMEYLKKNLLSAIGTLKTLVENVVVVSNLPTSDSYDTYIYEKTSVLPQDIADEAFKATFGNTMFIPMYDLYVRYCEDKNIDMTSTFYDDGHPNDVGYLIVFELMLQQLGLCRNYYTDFSANGSWWIGDEIYNTLGYYQSATNAVMTNTSILPSMITEGFNSELKSTGLSGKTITKVKIPFTTTGTITIGKVNMLNYGTGVNPELINSKQYTISKTGENEIFLSNLELGENETLAIGAIGDTATIKYIGNAFISEGGTCTLHTASAYKNGTSSTLSLICSVYCR